MFEFLFISLWNVLIIETTTVLSDTYIYCNRVGAGGNFMKILRKKITRSTYRARLVSHLHFLVAVLIFKHKPSLLHLPSCCVCGSGHLSLESLGQTKTATNPYLRCCLILSTFSPLSKKYLILCLQLKLKFIC